LQDVISGINWLDIIFVLALIGMIYRGSHAGVGAQLLSLAWCFLLIFVSIGYFTHLSSKLSAILNIGWARAIAFLGIILFLFAFIRFMEKVFNIQRAEHLAPIERIGGSLVAAFRAFLIFGIIGIQLLLIPSSGLRENVLEKSKSGMFFVGLDAGIYSFMSKYIDFVEDVEKEDLIQFFVSGNGEKPAKRET
jgi:hypothetical protein